MDLMELAWLETAILVLVNLFLREEEEEPVAEAALPGEPVPVYV